MCSTLFYLTLTQKEQNACDAMPALFKLQNPSDKGFTEAYAFMTAATDSAQRGVAKRWIMSHLADMEYALQPIEWTRYPQCERYYTQQGFSFDDEPKSMRGMWARVVDLMAADHHRRTEATPSGQGI